MEKEIERLIQNYVEEERSYIIKARHHLHQNPEISGHEKETSSFLKGEIRKFGLEPIDVPGMGFYAILDSGKAGKSLGIRCDMDALAIDEELGNLRQKRSVISKNRGVAHMCGHDGHMAVSLGLVKVLSSMKDMLKGRLIFIFEEGEETSSGIRAMTEALSHENLDAVFGSHLVSFLDTGKIAIKQGPVMAGCIDLDFVVKGKSGHGSRPDLSINPIFATSSIIQNLAIAWTNRIDPTKTVTLGLGTISGGSMNNIIPETVEVTGTYRFFDENEAIKAMNLTREVGDLTARAQNCKFIVNQMEITTNPVVNDPGLASLALSVGEEIFPNSIEEETTWMASETFEAYDKLAPILYVLIGTRNEELGSGAEHHSGHFDLDDESLIIASRFISSFAFEYLNQ